MSARCAHAGVLLRRWELEVFSRLGRQYVCSRVTWSGLVDVLVGPECSMQHSLSATLQGPALRILDGRGESLGSERK
jgi:hypothetical protein